MKLNPRIILGIAALVLITILLTTTALILKGNSSYILLTSEKNTFDLKFFITKSDQGNFNSILTNLEIPREVQKGLQFKLDSTSSAQLDFITPLKIKIKPNAKSIAFSGNIEIPSAVNLQMPQTVKLPKTTNLAIFAPSLARFVEARLNIPENISSWFQHNLASSKNSYLAIYSQNAQFSYLFKNNQINFDELKNIKDSVGNPIYKEETDGNTKLRLLQIPSLNSDDQQPQTLAFFTLGDFQIMSSSPDAANLFINSQSDPASIAFPQASYNSSPALVVNYINHGDNPVSKPFEDFLLQNWQGLSSPKSKIASSLENVQDASLILKEQSFSGLINLK